MNTRTAQLTTLLVLWIAAYGLGVLLGHPVNRAVRPRLAAPASIRTGAGSNPETELPQLLPAGEAEGSNEVSAFFPPPGTELEAFRAALPEMRNSATWNPRWFALLCALSTNDYPAAWSLVTNLPPYPGAKDLQESLVFFWSRKDPRAALTAVLHMPNSDHRNELLLRVLPSWSALEPEAALAWARQLPEGHPREIALAEVISIMTKQDPVAAVRLLDDLPAGWRRQLTAHAVIGSLASADPQAAVRLLDEVDPVLRQQSVSTIAAAMAMRSVQDGVAWAQSLPGRKDQQAALNAVISCLTETHPEQALNLVLQQPDENLRTSLAQSFAAQWAPDDAEAASNWVRQLPDGPLRRQALDGLESSYRAADPDAAANLVLTLYPADASRTAALQNMARTWLLTEGDDAAIRWAEQLPAGPDRDAFLSGLCGELASHCPDDAARLVASMPPGKNQVAACRDVAGAWAAFGDPAEAAAWGTTLPQGPARTEALSQIAATWIGIDPEAGGAWLRSLPADDERACVTEALVNELASRQPELAARWVTSVADEARRSQLVEKITRRWLRDDPAAAEAWIQETIRNPAPEESPANAEQRTPNKEP